MKEPKLAKAEPVVSRRSLSLLPRVGQPATPIVVTIAAEQRRGHETHDGLVQHRLAEVDAWWVVRRDVR